MADALVEIRHPDLATSARVPAGTVHIWARAGWKPARRVVERPAPTSIASPPADVQPGPEGATNDPPKEG